MSIVYPIADMLTRIRNATHKRHAEVSLPHSRVKEAIARILESEGYILGLEVVPRDPQPLLSLKLKYQGERSRAVPAITGIRLVSKPSRRVYAGKDDLPKPRAGMGTCIVSTSAGILSGVEAAARGLGGEVLFEVW